MIATTNLELSKRLQERWPDWETDFVHAEDNASAIVLDIESAIANDYDTIIAPTLDELRIKTLELIEEKKCWFDHESVQRFGLYNALKEALIQGPDPTAEWMLEVFVEGKKL